MREQSAINKKAWEYRAYEFWCKRNGPPDVKTREIMKDPLACLKKHKHTLNMLEG